MGNNNDTDMFVMGERKKAGVERKDRNVVEKVDGKEMNARRRKERDIGGDGSMES